MSNDKFISCERPRLYVVESVRERTVEKLKRKVKECVIGLSGPLVIWDDQPRFIDLAPGASIEIKGKGLFAKEYNGNTSWSLMKGTEILITPPANEHLATTPPQQLNVDLLSLSLSEIRERIQSEQNPAARGHLENILMHKEMIVMMDSLTKEIQALTTALYNFRVAQTGLETQLQEISAKLNPPRSGYVDEGE